MFFPQFLANKVQQPKFNRANTNAPPYEELKRGGNDGNDTKRMWTGNGEGKNKEMCNINVRDGRLCSWDIGEDLLLTMWHEKVWRKCQMSITMEDDLALWPRMI